MTDKSEEYRLYKFNGNLVSYENSKRNIDGWYSDFTKAISDLQRVSGYEGGQFVLVDKSHKDYSENGFIVALSSGGNYVQCSHPNYY
jgi:hypothetical protein